MAVAFVLFGLAIVHVVPFRFRPTGESGAEHDGPTDVAQRRLGFAFRRDWAPLIAIDLLYIAHWGVIVAFLPQRAEAAGANIGLFFVADGVAILLSRVPSGWLADRIPPIFLIISGLAATGVAVLVLTLPPTTPLLMVAGTLTGLGGGLVITPMLVEISRRSRDADRGSAFALFSAANAGALAIGSIGGAHRAREVRLRGRDARDAGRDHRGGPSRTPRPRATAATDADRAGVRSASRTRAVKRSGARACHSDSSIAQTISLAIHERMSRGTARRCS